MTGHMYGWRARIGLIYPASGGLDEEFWKFVPRGVTIFMARVVAGGSISQELTVRALSEMGQSRELEALASGLATAGANSIGFAETSATFIKGGGYDIEIAQRLEEASGLPSTTTSTASVEAMKKLGIKKPAVATPYPDEINRLLVKFLADNGIEAVQLKALDFTNGGLTKRQPPSVAYTLGRESDTSDADGIYIPCTDLRTAEVINALEKDSNKPVVTANQATMWKCLRLAGVKASAEGMGSLFNQL